VHACMYVLLEQPFVRNVPRKKKGTLFNKGPANGLYSSNSPITRSINNICMNGARPGQCC
jgi:hypothetical protein